MTDIPRTANEKANHFLGGYWKCEGCGLLIEDTLYVCPECKAKKTENENVDKRLVALGPDLDSYIGVNGITMDQQDEMIADTGYKGK
jgi:hypothetical protein